MLGLSNSVISSSSVMPIGTYTSDFTSGVDSWEPWSEQGTLTLQGNQNPSDLAGVYPDESGWLQGDYDTNQTNFTGIKLLDISTPWDRDSTDYFVWTCRIILASTPEGVANDWGTDDVTTNFRVGVHTSGGGEGISTGGDLQVTIPPHQEFAVSGSGIVGGSNYNDLAIGWVSVDRPLATARFYIKDIVVNFYK